MNDKIDQYKRALSIAITTLEFYADPESYHAIMIVGDAPCGDFAYDYSNVDHPHYDRMMHGKRARETLKKLEEEYGDLQVYSDDM